MVSADTGKPPSRTSVNLVNPLGTDNLQVALERAVPLLIAIAAPLATIMVLYGAFLLMTSAGNEEKISKGRAAIFWAAVGFLGVLVAGSIVPVIRSVFGN